MGELWPKAVGQRDSALAHTDALPATWRVVSKVISAATILLTSKHILVT